MNEHSVVNEGVQTVCPGELVSLICTHDNVAGQLTRWIVSGSQPCDEIVSHFTDSTEDMCGLFTITRIGNTVSTLYSTIQIPATEALDGTLVECFSAGLTSSPQVGNTTLNVISQ